MREKWVNPVLYGALHRICVLGSRHHVCLMTDPAWVIIVMPIMCVVGKGAGFVCDLFIFVFVPSQTQHSFGEKILVPL